MIAMTNNCTSATGFYTAALNQSGGSFICFAGTSQLGRLDKTDPLGCFTFIRPVARYPRQAHYLVPRPKD